MISAFPPVAMTFALSPTSVFIQRVVPLHQAKLVHTGETKVFVAVVGVLGSAAFQHVLHVLKARLAIVDKLFESLGQKRAVCCLFLLSQGEQVVSVQSI